MPYITIRIPSPSQSIQPTYPVNIDFDEASKAWRIHTQADNPKALRSRQRAYWAQVRKSQWAQARKRQFVRATRRARRAIVLDHTPQQSLNDCPIASRARNITAAVGGPRRSHRRTRAPKRLIEEI